MLHPRRSLFLVLALFSTLLAGAACGDGSTKAVRRPPRTAAEAGGRCWGCHRDIEDAHPRHLLYCVDCHGGDDTAVDLERAHVRPSSPIPSNPTILPVDHPERDYLRFRNPTDLRVVRSTCGKPDDGFGTSCHADKVDRVMKSMMATTPGHLAGGAYENGILPDRRAIWGNMPVKDEDGEVPVERGALYELLQVPPEDHGFPMDSFQRHYSDVPRKICARCHLWSRGKAVRGVPGQEGNYRSEGCAACHVLYANDGLSYSDDPTVPKDEVGHPVRHRITRKIPTEQCAHCHTRGARIGLSYQGLAQLPPGTTTGPYLPGLTPEPIYGAYHVRNPAVNPPDVHYERGMHCIDCHVADEIMGDGNIYGHMDQATEIECEDCHGTPDAYGDLVTARGSRLDHVTVRDGLYVLTSKVTGKRHVIPQVKDFTDPRHPTYNPLAARYMDSRHLAANGGLECYTCHSAWQNNCWGCHFERDLREKALDYFEGRETPGRPRTAKKYFLDFKHFQMGRNSEGKVAPYTVGCQVMATVIGPDGRKILEQKMPRTAAGFSGLSMNAVQPHTTRRASRSCQECHRAGRSLGLGSETFPLSRGHLYVALAGKRPAVVVLDVKDPARPRPVGRLELPDPRGLAVAMDEIEARARLLYVADGRLGLVTVDVSDPARPRRVSSVATRDARGIAWLAGRLLVADGSGGLAEFALADPRRPTLCARLAVGNARAVRHQGVWAYIAAGARGLVIADVAEAGRPRVVARMAFSATTDARDVFVMAHYGDAVRRGIKPFAVVAYVADAAHGVRVVDVTEPAEPRLLATIPTRSARAVFAGVVYDPGDVTRPSLQRDVLYVADGPGGLIVLDVTSPAAPQVVARSDAGGEVDRVLVTHAFEPPHHRVYAYTAVDGARLSLLDVSMMARPRLLGGFPAKSAPVGLAIERLRLDRFVNERGHKVKDSSHDGARPLDAGEIRRVLCAPLRGTRNVPPGSRK